MLFQRERLQRARLLARISGQDARSLWDRDELAVQHVSLCPGARGLEPHNRQCPKHQNEAGFLLVILDDDGQ